MAKHLILCWLVALLPFGLVAQETRADSNNVVYLGKNFDSLPDSTVYRVRTANGKEYSGYLLQKTDHDVILSTLTNEIVAIHSYEVAQMQKVSRPGDQWDDHPIGPLYFLSPSAFSHREAEGYYQNVMLLVNQVSIGITDNISAKAGIFPPVTLLDGYFEMAGWLQLKATVPLRNRKIRLGAAGAALSSGLVPDGAWGAYGVATFGKANSNSSVGAGRLRIDREDFNMISLSAKGRTGKKAYLATENLILWSPSRQTVILVNCTFGWIFRRGSVDLAVMLPFTRNGLFFVPLAGFRRTIGYHK